MSGQLFQYFVKAFYFRPLCGPVCQSVAVLGVGGCGGPPGGGALLCSTGLRRVKIEVSGLSSGWGRVKDQFQLMFEWSIVPLFC